MRAVLDTNVIVSGYLTPRGLAAQVMSSWRADRFQLLLSAAILSEIAEVLLRPAIRARHQLTQAEVREIVVGFLQFATIVEPTESIAVCSDPDDDMFLECAIAGGADVLVTRDPHLSTLKEYRGVRIVSPAVFVALLEAESRQ